MKKFSPTMLIAAIAVVVIAALVLTRPDGADVAHARAETQKAIALSERVLTENIALKDSRDSALAEAAKYEHSAVDAKHDLADAKRELFKAALAAPDTCGPVVLAAQAALHDADNVINSREHELAAALAADSVDSRRAASAEAALRGLKEPAKALVAATDNSGFLHRLARLRPELQAGIVGGIDVTGKPNAVIGVGFGWHF